ncbi:MAG: electron transport complex subunit E [Granulosicoccus sp.]
MTDAIDIPDPLPTAAPSAAQQLWKQGLWQDNPALVKLLGLCPLLAVSNTATNALALGVATTLTLLVTNVSVSLLRGYLMHAIRLPIYVLIIASSVTSIELLMQAWLPALHASLGIFLPLIVTNCLIIGRAEAFASRQTSVIAAIDALAMGVGFTWVLICLGAVREMIGHGTVFNDAQLLLGDFASNWTMRLLATEHTVLLALLPPGAFLILGLLLAVKNAIDQSQPNEQ